MEIKEQFAVQVGLRGFYAEVTIVIEEIHSGSSVLEFNTESRWTLGAQLAFELFLGHLRSMGSSARFRVNVLEIEGYPGDTTVMTVAYAVHRALSKATKNADIIERCFVFDASVPCFSIKTAI
jgi:hypothetical protein